MNDVESTEADAEGVASLLNYALLAPSSHNTQPWRFAVSGNAVALHADRTRALVVNDPDDRELTISCGCALLNLRVAAAAAGLGATCRLLPNPEDEDLLAAVELNPAVGEAPGEARLFDAIERRRTYRRRFESREVPPTVLHRLAEAAASEGAWLQLVDREEQRQAVAGLVAEGDAVQWSNPSWRRELAAWMQPRRRGDGLTVPGLVAPVARMVVRTFDMGNGVGAKDRELADGSPVLAVLGTDGDAESDWLTAGQALQRVLLDACGAGLQASYLNQPIQVPALRSRLQRLLGRAGFPQLVLRMGFPARQLPAAPRRGLAEVLDPS